MKETIEESIERIKAETRAILAVPKKDRKKLGDAFKWRFYAVGTGRAKP